MHRQRAPTLVRAAAFCMPPTRGRHQPGGQRRMGTGGRTGFAGKPHIHRVMIGLSRPPAVVDSCRPLPRRAAEAMFDAAGWSTSSAAGGQDAHGGLADGDAVDSRCGRLGFHEIGRRHDRPRASARIEQQPGHQPVLSGSPQSSNSERACMSRNCSEDNRIARLQPGFEQ